MTNSELYEQTFIQVFSLDVLPDKLQRGDIPEWDSIGHLHLIDALENAFDIMFDTEDIFEFRSFEKGKEILRKYNVEF